MKLTFRGANRQVTGSCYQIEAEGKRLLVDCGLFQERQYQQRNWADQLDDLSRLDGVLLTHAHLDHAGLLPRLVRRGYQGPIYATVPTIELAALVLHDSARLQKEDMDQKQDRHQREGRQSPHPYEPLYTTEDVERTLGLFRKVEYGRELKLAEALTATYHDAGHILGSAIIELTERTGGAERRLVFTGDLGQWNKPIIEDPTLLKRADYVVMESTYGDRDHDETVPIADQLAEVINDTVRRGGNIVVPTFAIERAQELLFHLSRLLEEDRIPHVLVFLDSPMAVEATQIFARHPEYFDAQTLQLVRENHAPYKFPGLVLARTTEQSKAINHVRGSAVILAGSGMCTGGRIKHHLVHNIERPEATILFVGYQGKGTLGRDIAQGAREVRIFGQMHPVRAQVAQIHGMSAHADRAALLRWLGAIQPAPKHVFLTHGEEDAATALAKRIGQTIGCPTSIPEYGQTVELT